MTAVDYSTLGDGLRVTCEGAVRIVTISRPEHKNSIDGALHAALAGVWSLLRSDKDARAVLLKAEGSIFTAGGDYGWFQTLHGDLEAIGASIEEGRRILDELVRFPLPIVTAIQGGAVGLGASLGLLSDLVIMAEGAFYRDPHVVLGITAGDGGVAWPMATSLQIAKQHLLLGDRLYAADAYRLGMVNQVVSPDELDSTARAMAARLAALPARAAQATKRGLNLHLERGIRGASEFMLASEFLDMIGNSLDVESIALSGASAISNGTNGGNDG